MKRENAFRVLPSLNRSLWLYGLQQGRTDADGHRYPCPKCQVAMRSIRLPSVVVEVCPQCRGLFLDDGELERLGR